MSFGYGEGSYGYGSKGESWQPPLFKIGQLPINVTGLVILLEVIGMLLVVAFPSQMTPLAAFAPQFVLKGAVWQIVTYAFFEGPSVMLILGLYFFYRFGGMVENSLGRSGYVRLLIMVLLVPPAVVMLGHFLHIPGYLLGSHLPHLAIFIAAVAMMPNAPTALLGFPIKWLAVVFTGIAFLQYAMTRNGGACFALLSVSYLAIWWMKKAGHVSAWGVIEDVFGPRTPRKSRKKSRLQKKKIYEKKLKPRAEVPSSKRKDIDRILDKINEHGLHSLSEEERKILKEASKK